MLLGPIADAGALDISPLEFAMRLCGLRVRGVVGKFLFFRRAAGEIDAVLLTHCMALPMRCGEAIYQKLGTVSKHRGQFAPT